MKTEEDEAFEEIERRQKRGGPDKAVPTDRERLDPDDAWNFAKHVWEEMDRKSMPGIYMQMVTEVIVKLYTSPPQRQWQGLTDEIIWLEYQRFWPFHPAEEPKLAKDIAKFARAIEAKLREKNV